MKQQLHNLKTTSTTLKTLCALVLFFLVNLSYGQIYVDNTATGTNDGSSWTDAYTSIQGAIDNATEGDEIRIATGVYTEGSSIDVDEALIIKGGYDTNTNTQNSRSTLDGEDAYYLLNISNVESEVIIENLNIINGVGNWYSGGIYVYNSTVSFNNITLSDNYCQRLGGGVYSLNSSATFTNSTFTNNISDMHGGAINVYGGSISISNGIFENNSTDSHGGGIHLDSYVTTATIENSVFKNNSANSGGAIKNSAENLIVNNTSFIENNTDLYGGAVRNETNTNAILSNSLFYNNNNNNTTSSGSVMYNGDTSIITLVNCTLFGTGTDKAIYNPSADTSLIFNNTVFYNNGTDMFGSGSVDSSFSNLASDNTGSDISSSTDFVDLSGVSASAIFVDINDPDGADDIWNTTDDGLALTSGSPLLDAGNNSLNTKTKDITGQNDRILNTTIDIGAYEFNSTLSISETNLNTELLLYPNPASDIINIRATQPITKIELFDVSGKSVLKTTHTSQININSLQPGLYLLNIVSKNTQTVKKLIIK